MLYLDAPGAKYSDVSRPLYLVLAAMNNTVHHHLLANDEDIERVDNDVVLNLQQANNDVCVSELGPLLSSSKSDTYSWSPVLADSLTLRNCNYQYGKFRGRKYSNDPVPELDRCITKGCISSLRRFQNSIGHFVPGGNEAPIFQITPSSCDMGGRFTSFGSVSTRGGGQLFCSSSGGGGMSAAPAPRSQPSNLSGGDGGGS